MANPSTNPLAQSDPPEPPMDFEPEPQLGLRVALAAAVVLIVLFGLYWGGKLLLVTPGATPTGTTSPAALAEPCQDETIYRGLEKALARRSTACYLDVSNQNLTNLSGMLGYLTKLRMLNASGNQLAQIPPQISYLRQLERLDLSGNQLTAIPAHVGYLKKLNFVDLSGNRLTALPAQVSYWRDIETLDLSNNQLTQLPNHIGYFLKLKNLDLRNNSLTALPQRIDNLRRLEKLELAGNPLPTNEIDRVTTKLPRAQVNISGGE